MDIITTKTSTDDTKNKSHYIIMSYLFCITFIFCFYSSTFIIVEMISILTP